MKISYSYNNNNKNRQTISFNPITKTTIDSAISKFPLSQQYEFIQHEKTFRDRITQIQGPFTTELVYRFSAFQQVGMNRCWKSSICTTCCIICIQGGWKLLNWTHKFVTPSLKSQIFQMPIYRVPMNSVTLRLIVAGNVESMSNWQPLCIVHYVWSKLYSINSCS